MRLPKIILIGGVALVSGVVGVLIPSMMSGSAGSDSANSSQAMAGHEASDPHAQKTAPAAKDPHGSKDPKAADPHAKSAPSKDSHGKEPHGAKPDPHAKGHGDPHGKGDAPKVPKVGPVYLNFDRLVLNLNEPNLIMFLSIDITVETDGKYEDEVRAAMAEKKSVLKTFLTTHCADKSAEDVRGKAGMNRLRREIQDNFNMLLFKDGHERITDVLFDEWHVAPQ